MAGDHHGMRARMEVSVSVGTFFEEIPNLRLRPQLCSPFVVRPFRLSISITSHVCCMPVHSFAYLGTFTSGSSLLNPKPGTLNSKAQVLDPKP